MWGLYPGHRLQSDFLKNLYIHFKVFMTLDDEVSDTVLDIVPESYGMDVPSACTIVIIAGEKRPLYEDAS